MRRHAPLLLILLLALALRLYQLTAVPPGLTHDEANHAREAIGVLAGDLRFYFPYNYGSEPVYSYTVAGAMALLGENLLALRLVNVFFGVAAIAMSYLWIDRAFDRRTALLAAGLLAVSFWPVASSREALRAGMLPFFMACAVWFFWQFLETPPARSSARRITAVLLFAVSLAITLHIYLAARVAWLLFPAFLLYLAWRQRPLLRRAWLPTLLGLLLTALLTTPMALYLRQNPQVQPRVSMLDGPLQQLAAGEFAPLLRNAADALLAFVWPGFGDQFLAYNVPGRPVLDPLTAILFALGLLAAITATLQNPKSEIPNLSALRSSLYTPRAFALLWFFIGILPSLITGPTA
ncbi:MAG: phospholipid carrier-dependent glycosyltransferase, partial [Anaerolineales bacterium]|nr:phospholipid carrier-dependent glycosyltransferase [Anaerolineales bacterium]